MTPPIPRTVRPILLVVVALALLAIVGDLTTTWVALERGAVETNPPMVALFGVIGPYAGMIVSSLIKLTILVVIGWCVRRLDWRLCAVYAPLLWALWMPVTHNLTVLTG